MSKSMLRVFVIVSFFSAMLVASASSTTLAATSYDFGQIRQGVKVVHRFTVANSTSAPLTVQRVEMSMPGMVARFRPVVMPGNDASIAVEWDTSRVSGEIEGEAIVYFAEASQRPVPLRLKGVVTPAIQILPYPAVFISAFRGDRAERRLTITNTEEQPLTVTVAQVGKYYVASLATVQAGKTYELVVRPNPGAPTGHYDEELSLATNKPQYAHMTIPVHIFVKADVYANPEQVDFGSVSAADLRQPGRGDLLTQTFLVKKRSGDFEIISITSDFEGLEIRKQPAAARSSTYRIDVVLNANKLKPGKIKGAIQITTNDPVFREIKVPLAGQVF